MREDDLPPQKADHSDEEGFSGALGRTIAGAVWVAAFAAIGGLVLYAIVHWF